MPENRTIFRGEALIAYQTPQKDGELLQLIPGWTSGAYWFLLLVVAGALGYGMVAALSEYAEGPAVLRVDGRVDLTTSTGGTVTGVDVQPGQTVKAGQVLVRFFTGAEQRELDRADREFQLKLARVLQDPSNEAIRQSLATLRSERELIAAKLTDRSVLAPSDGVVTNLRVRAGQTLAAGEVVMTLVDERASGFSVIVLVPGRYRPMLTPGMPMRLELDGYPYVYKSLTVESVGNEAVGPSELRRYLGQEVGDAVALEGSMVVVRARLPDKTFVFENKTYRFYDGLPGRVDIKVRSIRLLLVMFPALRKVLGDAA